MENNVSESPVVLFHIRHNLPPPTRFQKCNFTAAYWDPQCAGLETCMRTIGLGVICGGQAKNSGKENDFKSCPRKRDLERILRHITARCSRVNTNRTKKQKQNKQILKPQRNVTETMGLEGFKKKEQSTGQMPPSQATRRLRSHH